MSKLAKLRMRTPDIKLDRLLGRLPEAIRHDGDNYLGRTGWLEGLVADIICAARAAGRREARPPLKARRGLALLAGLINATGAPVALGHDSDRVLSPTEQTEVDNVDAACAWIREMQNLS